MDLCPEIHPRKNGHESSACLAELLFTQMSSTCGHAEGCQHHQEWVMSNFFFTATWPLHFICLSQICCSLICTENGLIGLCWKAGHGSLVGLAPGVERCLWSNRSAEQQQQDFKRAGWGGDNFQSWVCHKKINIHYPYSHIVYISDALIQKSRTYSQ